MSKRILIVDDAATVRLYCRQVLEAAGFATIEAANGVEGLERALLNPVDLILVDVHLPKMDGYGMLRALRRQPAIAALPA
ncbi:MAG: response regulator, partial [Alphaproteobacteria bacterium]|nr:response regulator [Alphaproteobacteria bacterium]